MSGSPLAENEVRSRLHSALDDIQPAARPLADVRRAVTRRRRQRQIAVLVAAGVLVGAGITTGLAATGGPGRSDKIVPEKSVDPVPALHDYVTAHDGTSATSIIAGPNGGTYAADIEAGEVHVLTFDGTRWTSFAPLGSPLQGGSVDTVRPGPDGAGDAVAFQVDLVGGDAVFNGIIVDDAGDWRYADFDCGTTTVACAGAGHRATKYAIDGTEVEGAFHSEPNDCTPSCVAGTRYDVIWRWDSSYGVFVVASAVKMP